MSSVSWQISGPRSSRLSTGRIPQKYVLLDGHRDGGIRQRVGEGWAWETYQRGERRGYVQDGESQGFACLASAKCW